jgi:hypothetical protein
MYLGWAAVEPEGPAVGLRRRVRVEHDPDAPRTRLRRNDKLAPPSIPFASEWVASTCGLRVGVPPLLGRDLGRRASLRTILLPWTGSRERVAEPGGRSACGRAGRLGRELWVRRSGAIRTTSQTRSAALGREDEVEAVGGQHDDRTIIERHEGRKLTRTRDCLESGALTPGGAFAA